MKLLFVLLALLFSFTGGINANAQSAIEADLLIVGGTESGCAAAVQAARMGVKRIVLVNDIDWLGGQFSAEGLGAIDENRAHGYNGSVPIPRSGIFRDVIDAIEAKNAKLYGGINRPGNTRVITTGRPVVCEEVFRELVGGFEKAGQLRRYSDYQVDSVLTEGIRVVGVKFTSTNDAPPLTVRARMTIDASDWGDVIKGSGAKWDAGVDGKSEFGEPSAPASSEPNTDMNPITWCMILEQRQSKTLFPKPTGYDPRYFNGDWGWIDEEFSYTTRRLVDGQGFEQIDHPDILLINTPPVDYPLDVFPAEVAAALEATERGASEKNLVAMTPRQREIVFQDARNHSLKYYYHLQQRFEKFRYMGLSDEFGTTDRLPPKPYIRESLRLDAEHILREQEVLGFDGRSSYATTMFPDAVFSWQFELDFHPTHREWTTDQAEKGPWQAAFRGNRRFGRGGTGRAVFPLRSLVPRGVHGLLGAQKSLGYTSIVSSSCRLHDQSIHAGQASGAVAAVSLRHDANPSEFYLENERIAEIWSGLLEVSSGAPLVIWPFSDVDPFDPGFVAIQQLALRRVLNLDSSDTAFEPDAAATTNWINSVLSSIQRKGYGWQSFEYRPGALSRREVAVRLWDMLSSKPIPQGVRKQRDDFDGDGLKDTKDPLPFTPGTVSWELDPLHDGLPETPIGYGADARTVNFTSAKGSTSKGFVKDSGAPYSDEAGFGWLRKLTQNTRLRSETDDPLRNGFVFTRDQDVWECRVDNGTWRVCVCLGDAGHEQLGQHLSVEGKVIASGIDTSTGRYHESETSAIVQDGRLTLTIGKPRIGSNTCINWVWFERVE